VDKYIFLSWQNLPNGRQKKGLSEVKNKNTAFASSSGTFVFHPHTHFIIFLF